MSATAEERDAAGAQIGAAVTDDGVRWLVLVAGEICRVALALLAKRYPEVRGSQRCPNCGHRH